MSLGVAAGLAQALWMAPASSERGAPSALAVITTQHEALSSSDPTLRARALELGADYLEQGPEGPYRDLIQDLHRSLEGTPQAP